jgi:hypothetical protein
VTHKCKSLADKKQRHKAWLNATEGDYIYTKASNLRQKSSYRVNSHRVILGSVKKIVSAIILTIPDCNKTIYQTICDTENRLVEGFTEEEKEQFFAFLNRAMDNVGGNPCKPKHKEEPET